MPVSLRCDAMTGLELAADIALRQAMAARRMDIVSQAMHVREQASARAASLPPYEVCTDPNSQK
jgi:hypothetical protein